MTGPCSRAWPARGVSVARTSTRAEAGAEATAPGSLRASRRRSIPVVRIRSGPFRLVQHQASPTRSAGQPDPVSHVGHVVTGGDLPAIEAYGTARARGDGASRQGSLDLSAFSRLEVVVHCLMIDASCRGSPRQRGRICGWGMGSAQGSLGPRGRKCGRWCGGSPAIPTVGRVRSRIRSGTVARPVRGCYRPSLQSIDRM